MLLFDIGANRGDCVVEALKQGYKVIAIEPGSRIYKSLVCNFIYSGDVVPLKLAVSDSTNQEVEFYECIEDGLSTIEKSWLTDPSMPYAGKEYRTIKALTITIDDLVNLYGCPNLIKIDVEGAEWSVLRGMTKKYNKICFEWTIQTVKEHEKQIKYLNNLGYTKIGAQFIENHLVEPKEWFDINKFNLSKWIEKNSKDWENEGWKVSNLRPTADVGMIWFK